MQLKPKSETPQKIGLGLALLLLGTIFILGNQKQVFSSTFKNEPVKVEGLSNKAVDVKNFPTKILIPSLSIDLPVKEAKVVNGYWEVFDDKAAWGEGSGIPGQIGNQVIFAHAREGLFLPLKDIKTGMKIYVFTSGSWFSYEVKEVKSVYPNEVSVIAPTKDETLTLYTCTGFKDTKRLIVVAKRV